jgi:hypothetical protein
VPRALRAELDNLRAEAERMRTEAARAVDGSLHEQLVGALCAASERRDQRDAQPIEQQLQRDALLGARRQLEEMQSSHTLMLRASSDRVVALESRLAATQLELEHSEEQLALCRQQQQQEPQHPSPSAFAEYMRLSNFRRECEQMLQAGRELFMRPQSESSRELFLSAVGRLSATTGSLLENAAPPTGAVQGTLLRPPHAPATSPGMQRSGSAFSPTSRSPTGRGFVSSEGALASSRLVNRAPAHGRPGLASSFSSSHLTKLPRNNHSASGALPQMGAFLRR